MFNMNFIASQKLNEITTYSGLGIKDQLNSSGRFEWVRKLTSEMIKNRTMIGVVVGISVLVGLILYKLAKITSQKLDEKLESKVKVILKQAIDGAIQKLDKKLELNAKVIVKQAMDHAITESVSEIVTTLGKPLFYQFVEEGVKIIDQAKKEVVQIVEQAKEEAEQIVKNAKEQIWKEVEEHKILLQKHSQATIEQQKKQVVESAKEQASIEVEEHIMFNNKYSQELIEQQKKLVELLHNIKESSSIKPKKSEGEIDKN